MFTVYALTLNLFDYITVSLLLLILLTSSSLIQSQHYYDYLPSGGSYFYHLSFTGLRKALVTFKYLEFFL